MRPVVPTVPTVPAHGQPTPRGQWLWWRGGGGGHCRPLPATPGVRQARERVHTSAPYPAWWPSRPAECSRPAWTSTWQLWGRAPRSAACQSARPSTGRPCPPGLERGPEETLKSTLRASVAAPEEGYAPLLPHHGTTRAAWPPIPLPPGTGAHAAPLTATLPRKEADTRRGRAGCGTEGPPRSALRRTMRLLAWPQWHRPSG